MNNVYEKVLEYKNKFPGTVAWRLKKHCEVIEGYINPDEVLDTYIQSKVLSRLLDSTVQEANPIHSEALNDKVNLGIQADLNSENPPKELTDLPSYQNYKRYQTMLDVIRKEVVNNNAKYSELTSNEYQEKLFTERQEKLKKGLEEAEIKAKKEADKEVEKRQKEVKKKVDETKNPDIQEAPAPTLDDEEVNLQEAELEPEYGPGFEPDEIINNKEDEMHQESIDNTNPETWNEEKKLALKNALRYF